MHLDRFSLNNGSCVDDRSLPQDDTYRFNTFVHSDLRSSFLLASISWTIHEYLALMIECKFSFCTSSASMHSIRSFRSSSRPLPNPLRSIERKRLDFSSNAWIIIEEEDRSIPGKIDRDERLHCALETANTVNHLHSFFFSRFLSIEVR